MSNLTVTRIPPTGDAEVFMLSAPGYQRKIVVSSAQMAVNPNAVDDAIRRAVVEMKPGGVR